MSLKYDEIVKRFEGQLDLPVVDSLSREEHLIQDVGVLIKKVEILKIGLAEVLNHEGDVDGNCQCHEIVMKTLNKFGKDE